MGTTKIRSCKEASKQQTAVRKEWSPIMPMIKMIVEAALEQELQEHLLQSKENRKNGKAPRGHSSLNKPLLSLV